MPTLLALGRKRALRAVNASSGRAELAPLWFLLHRRGSIGGRNVDQTAFAMAWHAETNAVGCGGYNASARGDDFTWQEDSPLTCWRSQLTACHIMRGGSFS